MFISSYEPISWKIWNSCGWLLPVVVVCVLYSVLRQRLGVWYLYRLSISLPRHTVKYLTPAVSQPCLCTCAGALPVCPIVYFSRCKELVKNAETGNTEDVWSKEAGLWSSVLAVCDSLFLFQHLTQLIFGLGPTTAMNWRFSILHWFGKAHQQLCKLLLWKCMFMLRSYPLF